MSKLANLSLLLAVLFVSFSGAYAQSVSLDLIGQYHTGFYDAGGAEISAYDPASQHLFFTNAEDNSIVALDLSDPENPVEVTSIDMSTYGGGVNSVAVYNGLVAVAVEAAVKTDNGSVVFFNASDASFISQVTVGALPDMVTFTPDGSRVLVANEGEPNDDYSVDPAASISIIDLSSGAGSATVSTADFTAFDGQEATLRASGVRIFGPGASASQDLEPEYIAVDDAGTTAYAILQENNAIAVIDINAANITAVLPLGFKDHSVLANAMDVSNRDDEINIAAWPVFGMYQPDAIASYSVDGQTYIVSANEGDARDYDTYSEEARVRDVRLNPSIFTQADLQENENLGRINMTTTLGTNADSLFFVMEADSAQQPTGGDDRGSGEGEFKYDVSAQTLTFTMQFAGLDFNGFNGDDTLTTGDTSDDVTMMHFHDGVSGVNGGVIFDILNDADTQVSTDEAGITTVTGVWSESDASFAGKLAEMQAALFEDEISIYVNVHTVGQPGGAIRGQMIADPMFDELYVYGARSFAIWNGTDGSLVWDSGSDMETRLSLLEPDNFNSTNSDNDSFDNRSDDKGPEPEAVTIVKASGKIYAFVALERIGGIMVYDITNPNSPRFVAYDNVRNFDEMDFMEDTIVDLQDAGDDAAVRAILESVVASGPESITFLKQGASPVAAPLAVVSNEVTGSVTIHQVSFTSTAAPIFISEYADGDGGNNKYIELYNPTDQDVVLGNYAFARVNNAPTVAGEYENWEPLADTDTIKANSTFLWVNPNAVDSLLNIADATGDASFNGDDAIALVFGTEDNYEILDMFGSFLGDPGSGWDVAGIANATADRTLIRKASVKQGNPAPLGSFGSTVQNSEWIVGEDGANDFSNAGMHMIDNSIRLTILHNNDGESQLIDLGSDTLSNFGGVARFKTVVENLRAENTFPGAATVLLSSGDNFLAGPEFNAGLNDGIFYDAVALDLLGYDAIALGNHDFDFGPQTLADFINSFEETMPPYVSANLDFSAESSLQQLVNEDRIASRTVIEAGGQMIGIVGATTPNLPFVSSPGLVEVDTDVLNAVQAEVDALMSEGINKIVLISHLQGIAEDSLLATQLSGVDVVIAGGGDELLANSGDLLVPGDEGQVYADYPVLVQNADDQTVPIVTTKGSYSYVGKLTVDFDENGDLIEVVAGSGPVRISGVGADAVTADAEMQAAVVDPVEAFLEALDQNVIAQSSVALDGVRGNVRGQETNLGNLIADAYLEVARSRAASFGVQQPDVALQNGGGIRNDNVIAAGDITELLTFDILPFGNFLSVVENIPPAQFKEIMENAVSKIDSDSGEPTGSGTGRFAQAAGFTFVYDQTRTPRSFDADGNVTFAGDRIIDIVLDNGTFIVRNGEVVSDAPLVSLAIGDFNARGGDQYPFGDLGFTRLGITDQQAFAQFISGSDFLNGSIGSEYVEGGSGRITRTGTPLSESRVRPDGVIVTLEAVVTRTLGGGTRLEDETAGLFIRHTNSNDFAGAVAEGVIEPGSVVRITGELSSFSGLKQINNNDLINFEVIGSTEVPDPFDVTLQDIAENGEFLESRLISVSDITIDPDGDTEFNSSTTYNISTDDDETGKVTLRIGGSNDTDLDGSPIPTQTVDFIGVLTQFNSFGGLDDSLSYQLLPIYETDLIDGFTLSLLHNNDGESQLLDLGGDLSDFGGVARFKTLVDMKKAENKALNRGVLMLSSGDNFLAGPEYTVGVNDSVFYDAIAVDAIGYDALALGNHDFDFGPGLAADFMSQVNSIFLSSNLDYSANADFMELDAEDKLNAGVVFEVLGEEIGVVGAITPNLPFISSPGDVEVLTDVVAEVQETIDLLEASGVNKIILISHLQGVEEDSLLTTQLSGIDVVIAGGGDELLANEGDLLIPGDEEDVYGGYPLYAQNQDGNQVPIVTGKGNYSYLGQLVVEFDDAGNVISVSDESGPIRVAGGDNSDAVAEDEFLLTNVVEPVAEGLSGLAANVIAETQVPLDGRRSSVRSQETNQGNLIADAFLWQANQLNAEFGAPEADIAVANGGGIRNDNILSTGNITELNTFDMLPFLNFITIVEGLSPELFKEMMENAVSRISLDAGEPVATGGGTGRYAQFAGFSMEFNPELQALEYGEDGEVATPGQRVIDLILDDGTAIVLNGVIQPDAPTVNLATADFTARGGDQYPTGDLDLTLVGVTYQQALFNYLTAPASEGGLEGVVSSTQYPQGGEGRALITDRTPVNNEIDSSLPAEYSLSQNYPNPFNPSTNIKFDLPQSAQVRLEVYNMLGQKVATLVDNRMEAGFHEVSFDARNLASGMYLYRIEAGSFSSIKKMMLIK